MKLSLLKARRLAIHCQGLDGRWKLPTGKEGAARAIERLGYVQIDTIAVVERAHHHIIWPRCPDYTPEMLHELQAADRRVFEGHTRCAAYLPMSDYRYYLPGKRAYAGSKRAQSFMKQNARLVEHVRGRIRDEGPLGSADFEAPPGRRGSWWDWKPAKRALEILLHAGELMVAERRNFQRMYDLTERVLPPGIDTTPPDPEQMARFVIRRVLSARGFARAGDIRWGWRPPQGLDGAMEDMTRAGEVTPVQVADLEGQHYALTETLDAASRLRRPGRLHILSPFDSLVIHRRRLYELFGFECKLECYMPAAKRRWGYFCLPILWRHEFVGRLDAKADRKGRTLIVRRLMLEPDFKDHDAVLEPLADGLRAFAAFNQCDAVTIEETTPRKVRPVLRRELEA
ncbi:MAG: crosslink repair DNA glycosylase YcaQ family protein [Candidatus Brocadiaceae bacterium]|jgi:hypothetical protein